MTSALLTDRYELTMLDAALRDGTAHRGASSRCSRRRLPVGRRYGVVAGTGRLLELIREFRFEDAELEWLRDERSCDAADPRLARGLPVHRRHLGLPRGRGVLPGSPVLVGGRHLRRGGDARDPRARDAQLRLRRRSAAARMVVAAGDRPHRRDGLAPRTASRPRSPRPGPRTSPASARPRTSRPAAPGASRRWAPRRTRSPCCTTREEDAFRAQVAAFGAGHHAARRHLRHRRRASRRPCDVAGTGLGAVRIDSRRPAARGGRGARAARRARRDRHADHGDERPRRVRDRRRSRRAPVDSYGVGTSVVTGSGAPTAGMVYKLVARQGRRRRVGVGGEAVDGEAVHRRPQIPGPHAHSCRHRHERSHPCRIRRRLRRPPVTRATHRQRGAG